jgi:hypothetical protein
MEHTSLSDDARCNYCGYPYDTATGINARIPDPGDVSMCVACGTLEFFIMSPTGMVTRPATLDEVKALANDETIAKSVVTLLGMRALDHNWPKGSKK